jgi:hypothetical protein
MDNVWVVVPVKNNDLDLADFVSKLTGGFVAPDTYEKISYEYQDGEMQEIVESLPHPYAGQTSTDLSGKIVFVNTKADYPTFDGVTHLEDFEDINLYRYWNTGIDYAVNAGADAVLVLSNPIDFDPFLIDEAVAKLDGKEVVNVADGAGFVISGTSEIRLDEQFQIWFGDNDLYRTAQEVEASYRSDFSNWVELDPWVIDTPELQEIVTSDEVKYSAKWS